MKRIVSLLLAASIISGCTQYKDGKPVGEKKVAESAAKPQKELSLDEKVTATIQKIAGKEAEKSEGKKRIISIATVDDAVAGEDNKIVNIELNADQQNTVAYTRDKMLLYSKDIFPGLFILDGISEVSLVWHLLLVDAKGNDEDVKVMQIRVKKDNNINWKNFDVYQFEKAADQYYEHQALKAK